MRLSPALLGAALACLGASGPALASGTIEDFAALCPAALLGDAAAFSAAREATGLTHILNQPLAFGWDTTSLVSRDDARSALVTDEVFGDAEHTSCAVELDRPLTYEAANALQRTLETQEVMGGPLDGKIYLSAGTVGGRLKRPGTEPLVTLSFGGDAKRSVLTLEVWRSKP